MDTSPFDQTDDWTSSDPVATAEPPTSQNYSFPSDGGAEDDAAGALAPAQDDDFGGFDSDAVAAGPDTAGPSSWPGGAAGDLASPGPSAGMASGPEPSPVAADRLRRGKVSGEDIARYGFDYYTTLDGNNANDGPDGDSGPGGSSSTRNIIDWTRPRGTSPSPMVLGRSWSFDGPDPGDNMPVGPGWTDNGMAPGIPMRGASWSFDGPYPEDNISSGSGAVDAGWAATANAGAGAGAGAVADAPPLTPERAQAQLQMIAEANDRRAAKGLPPLQPPAAILAAAFPGGSAGTDGSNGSNGTDVADGSGRSGDGGAPDDAGGSAPGPGLAGASPAAPAFTPEQIEQSIDAARNGQKRYNVDAQGMLQWKDGTRARGIQQAAQDGLLDPQQAQRLLPLAQQADAQYHDLVQAAGSDPKLKAFLVSGVKSAIAMEAGAALSSGVGAVTDAELAAIGGVVTSETGGWGAVVLPLIVHGITFLTGQYAADKALKVIQAKLAGYSDTVKALDASEQLEPAAARWGALVGGLRPAISSVGNLARFGSEEAASAAEKVLAAGGDEAAANAARLPAAVWAVGGKALIGAANGAAFEGVLRPAYDALLNQAADAAGIDHEQFQSPTVRSILTSSALGALMSDPGIKSMNVDPARMAEVFGRWAQAVRRGIPIEQVLSPADMALLNAAAPKVAQAVQGKGGSVIADPNAFQFAVHQAFQDGGTGGRSAAPAEGTAPEDGAPDGIPGLNALPANPDAPGETPKAPTPRATATGEKSPSPAEPGTIPGLEPAPKGPSVIPGLESFGPESPRNPNAGAPPEIITARDAAPAASQPRGEGPLDPDESSSPAPSNPPSKLAPPKVLLPAHELLPKLQPHIDEYNAKIAPMEREIARLKDALDNPAVPLAWDQQMIFLNRLDTLKTVRTVALQPMVNPSRAIVALPTAHRGSLHITGAIPSSFQTAADGGCRIVETYVHKDLLPKTSYAEIPPKVREVHKGRETAHLSSTTEAPTAAHEIAHGIEKQFPHVLDKSRDFLAQRAGGKAPVPLKQIYPTRSYEPDEVTFEDEWIAKGGSAYSGRDYSQTKNPKDAPFTEILTMGLQRLHKNPALFAATDPEYFAFVVNTLRNL